MSGSNRYLTALLDRIEARRVCTCDVLMLTSSDHDSDEELDLKNDAAESVKKHTGATVIRGYTHRDVIHLGHHDLSRVGLKVVEHRAKPCAIHPCRTYERTELVTSLADRVSKNCGCRGTGFFHYGDKTVECVDSLCKIAREIVIKRSAR